VETIPYLVPGSSSEILRSKGKMDTMLIEEALERGAKEVFMVCDDIEASWEKFREQFECVRAAGGLVLNEAGQMLFIFRHGKWDLPKGKIEDGESDSEAALREVIEECSVFGLSLGEKLLTTWHTYIQEGTPMLKPTEWFLMQHNGNEQARPQESEGISEIRWITTSEIPMVRKNTYPSVIDVFEEYERRRSSRSTEN